VLSWMACTARGRQRINDTGTLLCATTRALTDPSASVVSWLRR